MDVALKITKNGITFSLFFVLSTPLNIQIFNIFKMLEVFPLHRSIFSKLKKVSIESDNFSKYLSHRFEEHCFEKRV